MGQEFFIKSDNLESKVRQLLPSQGGLGAGFDLSASTQIIPIVDLTESAEGSNVRQDLQTALSFDNITAHQVTGTTTTIINNTGYYTVTGYVNIQTSTTSAKTVDFILSDGATDKTLFSQICRATTDVDNEIFFINFTVFISAGDSLKITADVGADFTGSSRQIADINGVLTPIA